MQNSDLIRGKRPRLDHLPDSSVLSLQKHRAVVVKTASVYIQPLGEPLVPTTTGSLSKSIRLEPHRPFTIGRSGKRCNFVIEDRRVSKRHCQILFDALNRKICIADGVFWSVSSACSRVRVSSNGVFVNGVRIPRGEVAELGAGDDVSLVCGNGGVCSSGIRIGFLVQRIVFVEEVIDGSMPPFRENGLSSGNVIAGLQRGGVIGRLNLLSSQCRQILHSNDPIASIQKGISSHNVSDVLHGLMLGNGVESPVGGVPALVEPLSGEGSHADQMENVNMSMVQVSSIIRHTGITVVSEVNPVSGCHSVNGIHLQQMETVRAPHANNVTDGNPKTLFPNSMLKGNTSRAHWCAANDGNRLVSIPPPGGNFYLNRLESVGRGSLDNHRVVSLPEILYPVESLSQIFIATFTSDISWFLSYCEIPARLPVTIACHNRERCWSSSPDKRIDVPSSDFPNLVVVYPPFPDDIAFGKDRKRLGIACHHPKLFVLLREDSLRVVITSANLGAKQWNSVTNTVWWQDFPRASSPDYLSLFAQLSDGDINLDSQSDFSAQLAGFMASLVAEVPSQAHWILELAKYNFKGAVGHLVASVPGMHYRRAPSTLESMYFMPDKQCASQSYGVEVLGSVETSVVGLSHLFRTSRDSNGAQLRKLASFLRKGRGNANGMLEIVLKRNTNIPADANTVSILVPNPEESSKGDFVQLGFLPRNVAKWVAPLADMGLFRFSGHVYPREVLATTLEGSTSKVQMLLYVSQGPAFSDMPKVVQSEHVSAICSLVASIQRSTGLWRLQEVLKRYKWPEHLETDFVFGSSSVGSVNAQFLAAFSAAAGKTSSVQLSDSEESDPNWCCWSASQELINPSMRIIFPTIERVKNARCGILASRYLLSFSQKTWQRLSNIGILHDAIPFPNQRVNHPMHVKVARRRFQSKKDTSSFGWVYCGSHNFSAAAWGRPLSNSQGIKTVGAVKNSVLGSRLHICNYELGIIFIVPPSDTKGSSEQTCTSLDDIVLPFVVPAPKYRPSDMPATPQAMREAFHEHTVREKEMFTEAATAAETMEEEIPDEEEIFQATDYIAVEKEDEKAYAETLWSQVDSSESC